MISVNLQKVAVSIVLLAPLLRLLLPVIIVFAGPSPYNLLENIILVFSNGNIQTTKTYLPRLLIGYELIASVTVLNWPLASLATPLHWAEQHP
jgi:hypothetical protein